MNTHGYTAFKYDDKKKNFARFSLKDKARVRSFFLGRIKEVKKKYFFLYATKFVFCEIQ